MKYTIEITDVREFRLAQSVVAKDGVRYYLNGVYLEPSKGTATGADCHRLACAPAIAASKRPSAIIRFSKMIPMNAVEAEIRMSDCVVTHDQVVAGNVVMETKNKRGTVVLIPGEIIDGKYPNYDRVIPDPATHGHGAGIPKISFNASYVADMVKAFNEPFHGVTLSFDTADDSILVGIQGSSARCMVMPLRV